MSTTKVASRWNKIHELMGKILIVCDMSVYICRGLGEKKKKKKLDGSEMKNCPTPSCFCQSWWHHSQSQLPPNPALLTCALSKDSAPHTEHRNTLSNTNLHNYMSLALKLLPVSLQWADNMTQRLDNMTQKLSQWADNGTQRLSQWADNMTQRLSAHNKQVLSIKQKQWPKTESLPQISSLC